jgi:hypothetical protein
MAEASPQTYATHRRFIPLFHFVAFGIVVLFQIWTIVELVRRPSLAAVAFLLQAAALLLLFFYTRIFALTVQDRVIRLEERLRLERLLPPDLRARIVELTPSQLIGLRFASDGEVPELTRWILDQGVYDREAIKKRITTWRSDTLRV